MTLPQAIYMWVMGREIIGRDRQIELVLLTTAIARALGAKGSDHAFPSLMAALVGEDEGVGVDVRQWSETQKLVMFGNSRMGGGDGESAG